MTRRAEDWEIDLWARGVRGRWWRDGSARITGAIRARLSGRPGRRSSDVAVEPTTSVVSAAPATNVLVRLNENLAPAEPVRRATG
jgi:hypothetical protein